ncbi:MAG: hypothetical protein ABI183_21885 [Polyangiaceae bacterium]
MAVAFVLSVVGVACATGSAPETGGGTAGPGGNDDSGTSPFTGYGDSGTGTQDGGYTPPPKTDSGTVTPIDSGTVTPIDSGTTLPPTLCTGQTSSHSVPSTGGDKDYDIWCDYDSFYGDPLPCTDNSDCSGNYTASYEPECCYKPVSGGYCEGDFKGKSQCVPK